MVMLIIGIVAALAALGGTANAAYISDGQAINHFYNFEASNVRNALHTSNNPVVTAAFRTAGNQFDLYYKTLMGDGSHCYGHDVVTSYGSPYTTSWGDADSYCYARG
jgi:hypothetical protein